MLAAPMDIEPLTPGLYIVATPIGNLGDVSARAADVLARADLIAAEDTRVTSKLLRHLGLKRPMAPYHDHNAETVRPGLIARMATGSVALVSDAGTPLVSDPGYKLVRDARAAGVSVVDDSRSVRRGRGAYARRAPDRPVSVHRLCSRQGRSSGNRDRRGCGRARDIARL